MALDFSASDEQSVSDVRGVEMRVHGIGDHELFSALGKPEYKETADDRVWIGSLPRVPKHELKLVNWSRASRKISRSISWYLAYPFTLLNVAGYMAPARRGDEREEPIWWLMRGFIVISSLLFTLAVAAWLTVILETAWRSIDQQDDRLSNVCLTAFAPTLLIILIVNRMIRGRALADKGNWWVSALTLGVLLGSMWYLAGRPADRDALFDFGRDSQRDPMTEIVAITTGIVWSFALVLSIIAWLAARKSKYEVSQHPDVGEAEVPVDGRTEVAREQPADEGRGRIDRTALAGAGILMALGIAILHTAGSMLRLVTQALLHFTPFAFERGGDDSASLARPVLLPYPDDVSQRRMATSPDELPVSQSIRGAGDRLADVQRIDLIPVFFLTMAAVVAVLLYIEYRRRRTNEPFNHEDPDAKKPEVTVRKLIGETPTFLGRTAVMAIIATIALWVLFGVSILNYGASWSRPLLIALQILGIVAIVLIVVRRPEALADRLRRVFGSLADIAGFWAPDLHPLAGASYRRALLRGLREGVRDIREDHPDTPIALVGHSQGSVVCAWFVRGGHWKEKRTESRSDEMAIRLKLHKMPREQSDIIALFTCGSPLQSLYRRFFPRYFDDEFFERTVRMSYGNIWFNYWRATDPIGTALSPDRCSHTSPSAIQNRDVTELARGVTKGHGEYWQDTRLRDNVLEYFRFFDRVRPWQKQLTEQSASSGVPIQDKYVRATWTSEEPPSIDLDTAVVGFRRGDEEVANQQHLLRYRNGLWDHGCGDSEDVCVEATNEILEVNDRFGRYVLRYSRRVRRYLASRSDSRRQFDEDVVSTPGG